MSTVIDVPTVDEVDEIATLWVELAREQREYGSHLLSEANRDLIYDAFARHVIAEELLVAREDEDIVGFVTFSPEYRLYDVTADRGIVHNLYVRPGDRGRGIGSTLLTEAEDRLFERGVGLICLEALSRNERARAFYRRNGYQPHRVQYEKHPPADDDRRSRNG